MSKVGYARVSSQEQNLTLQLDALRGAGCDLVFQEKASGAATDRPGLRQALERLGAGDTLVVWKLDRLGRSVKGLVDLVGALGQRGADFQSVSDGITTTGPMGRFFFHVMAAFAEMERELLRERTKAGLAAAKARGRTGGRPRVMTAKKKEIAQRLLAQGIPMRDVAESLEVSIPTIYRWLPASARNSGAPT